MNNQNQKKSSLMSMCWNWKGLVALIGIGIALFVFFPARAWAIAPFLLFALCPISMLFCMRGMKEKDHDQDDCASCQHDHGIEGAQTNNSKTYGQNNSTTE